MLLMDIAIEHTKKSRVGGADQTFTMHPFENQKGPNAGSFEVLRDIVEADQPKRKRSVHVTLAELAELYARGLIEAFNIRLRVRSSGNDYPTSPPGKRSCLPVALFATPRSRGW